MEYDSTEYLIWYNNYYTGLLLVQLIEASAEAVLDHWNWKNAGN